MSSVATGPVIGIGAAAIGIAAVAVPLLAVLLGRTTMLVAKGVAKGTVYVGKQVRQAYLEHEHRQEERLRKDAEVNQRIAELRRALSLEIVAPSTRSPVVVKRVKARVLNRVAAESALAVQLLREVEAVGGASQDDGKGVPEVAVARLPDPAPIPLSRPAQAKPALVTLVALDAAARRRIDGELRQALLDETLQTLAALPLRHDLMERLETLRLDGTLAACESLLADAHEARRQVAGQAFQAAAHQGLADRVLALRLAAEHLRPLAEGERRVLRKAAEELDQLLEAGRCQAVETRLKELETSIHSWRQRDVAAWLARETEAQDALRQAQSVRLAITADEGFSAVIEKLGRAPDLAALTAQLQALEAQILAGQFNKAVVQMAQGLRDRLAAIRDDALEAVRREGISSIVQVVQRGLAERGFEDDRLTNKGEVFQIEARRGSTSLWVKVDGDACLTFDLGSGGFASQRECYAEIDAFLQFFHDHGVMVAGMRSHGKLVSSIQGGQKETGTAKVSQYVHAEPVKLKELEG